MTQLNTSILGAETAQIQSMGCHSAPWRWRLSTSLNSWENAQRYYRTHWGFDTAIMVTRSAIMLQDISHPKMALLHVVEGPAWIIPNVWHHVTSICSAPSRRIYRATDSGQIKTPRLHWCSGSSSHPRSVLKRIHSLVHQWEFAHGLPLSVSTPLLRSFPT